MEPDIAGKFAVGKAEGQLRKGALEHCVLALLRDGPCYGVQLLEALDEAGSVMAAGQGTIYPLLSRLRRDGLVDTRWQESPIGPPRRYYELTPAGRAALKGFTDIWPHFRGAVDRFIAA